MQESAHGRENILLLLRAAGFEKCVFRIARKAAGKIAAIIWIGAAEHADFVAVIELRNPPQSEDEAVGELEFLWRAAGNARKARDIMIAEKIHEIFRMRVEAVLAKDSRDASRGSAEEQNVTKGEKKRVIENGGETGVHAVPILLAPDEKGSDLRIGMEHFADRRETGIDTMKAGGPAGPEFARDIGNSVHAKTIEARGLDPPDAVLQKVLLDDGIFRIEIRKDAEKPTVGEIAAEALRSVGIGERFKWIVADGFVLLDAIEGRFDGRERIEMFLRSAVKPVRQRRIFDPRMMRAHMIGNGVEENLDALLVGSGDEVLIIGERAEMRIHGVEVHGAITVIILRGAILNDRGEPEGGDAEILEIGQMLADAAEIAAVIGAGIRAVVSAGSAGRRIVREITIGEAVRHDEIKSIRRRETLITASDGLARSERQFKGSFSARSVDATDERAGKSGITDLEPDEKIIAMAGGLGVLDDDLGKIAADVDGLKIVAIDQKHEIGCEMNPPVGRLDLRDDGSVGRRRLLCVEWRRNDERSHEEKNRKDDLGDLVNR